MTLLDGFDFPDEYEFRQWLDQQDPTLKLFQDWGWFGCPVWWFLASKGFDPTIYRDGTWHPEKQSEYIDGHEMPPWASEFVWLSDLIKPRFMTPQDCINLLDNPLFRPEYWLSGKKRNPILPAKD